MERLIVLDTETTGLSPKNGDRIVEIGCVELLDMRIGDERQWYINPERDIPQEAIDIHGITEEMVKDQPIFSKVAKPFLDFIGGDKLVIHNASFDMRFINHELSKIGLTELKDKRVIDSLTMARRKFPGAPASLDALCRRFQIDNSNRVKHGALLDAHLLAEVYVELTGGNQFSLALESGVQSEKAPVIETFETGSVAVTARSWPVPQQAKEEHEAYLTFLDELSDGCIWRGSGDSQSQQTH
ncbi:MAG: DNA polymerase III subunit epsilon [Magnetococcales bacterium]|nr:DNA polymerase III subunit epsilon [Magnetococcales bacterium]